MASRKWLDYSGQSVAELVEAAAEYRIDSIVCAFEAALYQKIDRSGEQSLSAEERVILAVEALEREVNNGGYNQFVQNSSNQYTPIIVDSLRRIGCPQTAAITQAALDALAAPEPIREQRLNDCDDRYFQRPESIEDQLFNFIQANKEKVKF